MPRVTRALQQSYPRFIRSSPGSYRINKAIASAEAIASTQRRRVQLVGRHGAFISRTSSGYEEEEDDQQRTSYLNELKGASAKSACRKTAIRVQLDC